MTVKTGKRQNNKKVTRKRLIDSAIDCFGRSGIVKTKTVEVAKSADVSHGTVFLHFSTKDELLIEVLSEFGRRVTRRMRELTDSGMGVEAVLGVHLKVIAEYEDVYYRLVAESANLPDEVELVMVSIQSAISHTLNVAVRKEVEMGRIKHMPMHLLFCTWIGLLHHYLLNKHLFCPEGSLIKKNGQMLLSHFMSLIRLERT